MRNQKYTLEFKIQAIELAKTLGSATKAAEQLDLPVMYLYVWKRRLERQGLLPDRFMREIETPEQKLKRLRSEVADQKQVIHILKSAAAFFCLDQKKNDSN